MATVVSVGQLSDVAERSRASHRRRLTLSLLVVGVVALAVAWLGDPRAASFSDGGGRIATVKHMADESRWVPDLGYWAASVDPGGGHHPILFAKQYEDSWVAVNSLPLVVAGRPLWQIGGAHAAVLLSVLSVVLAAYAARRISRWASGGDGWLALWFVGLLSPALFYGADFWEHAPALALALLAVALALEGGMRRVAIAGLLAGIAAVMRNDMLVSFVALGLGALLVRSERTRTLSRWRELAVGAGMLGLVLFANGVVERIVLGTPTGSSRAVQRAGVAGLAIGGRARDAVITTFGVLANENWLALVIGGVIGIGILLMAAAAVDTSESQATGVAGAVIAWVGLTWRFVAFGVSAVPGFIPAAPVAALGLFGKRTDREQVLFLGAVIALPVIWMTEWVGGHAPQWGARYLLLPTALLVVLAAGQAMRLGPRALVVALVALGAVMSLIGATWHIERTRAVTEFAHEVFDAPPETVIISDTAYWGSEFGNWYGDRRWLTSGGLDGRATPADLVEVVSVARRAGATTIDVLDSSDGAEENIDVHPTYDGYEYESARTASFLGDDIVIRRYVAI